jgi:hypothetical protein
MCRPLTLSEGSLANGYHDHPKEDVSAQRVIRSQQKGQDHDLPHQPRGLHGRSQRGAAPGGRELLRQAGAANPAVKSYVVGPEVALQARNYQEHPGVAAVVAQAASFTVPDGKGSAA